MAFILCYPPLPLQPEIKYFHLFPGNCTALRGGWRKSRPGARDAMPLLVMATTYAA